MAISMNCLYILYVVCVCCIVHFILFRVLYTAAECKTYCRVRSISFAIYYNATDDSFLISRGFLTTNPNTDEHRVI